MATFEFSETAVIPASPQIVYSILADYVNGHPRILPEKVFGNMRVESGGYGAGTRVRLDMRVLGSTHTLHAAITEPDPGRVLVETYLGTATVTTFTVEPGSAGPHGSDDTARVTFHTQMTVPGFAGWVQQWLLPKLLRPTYREELRNLAAAAQKLQAQRKTS